jgi:prolyl 4-hydroxylase
MRPDVALLQMHDIPFRGDEVAGGVQHVQDTTPDAGACVDGNPRCGDWAAAEQCTQNREYMTVNCRKSCKACEACLSSDMECINRNRQRGGYWQYNKEELEWLGAGDLWKQDMSPEL